MSLGVIIAICLIGLLVTNGILIPKMTKRGEIRKAAIRYIELENNKRWGTFVDADDTLYVSGYLMIFDTVNLVYKTVAKATIQPIDGKDQIQDSIPDPPKKK